MDKVSQLQCELLKKKCKDGGFPRNSPSVRLSDGADSHKAVVKRKNLQLLVIVLSIGCIA
jgi:hypothetical protein